MNSNLERMQHKTLKTSSAALKWFFIDKSPLLQHDPVLYYEYATDNIW